MRLVYLACLFVCLYAVPAMAQSSFVVQWTLTADPVWATRECRVYKTGSSQYWATTAQQIAIPAEPGESGWIYMTCYGWKLDDAGQTIWGEGAKSAEVPYAMPQPSPPPALETCGADGLGNGIDEDADGLIDEICLPPPSDTIGPAITSFVIGRRTGQNYPVTLHTSDPSGVDHVEFWVNTVMQVRLQAPTSGLTMYASKVQIKTPGSYTVTAKSYDAYQNVSTHSLTVTR